MYNLLAGPIIPLEGASPWISEHYTIEKGLPYFDMNSMVQDKKGLLYFSAWGRGIYRYDGKTWTLFNKENSGLLDNVTISMTYDGEHSIYIAHFRTGVTRLDTDTGEIIPVISKELFTAQYLSDIYYDSSSEKLFILTLGSGFYTYNIKEKELMAEKKILSSREINSSLWESSRVVFKDSKSRIWIGAGGGVILYNHEGASRFFPYENSVMQEVSGIYEEKDHRIYTAGAHYMGIIDEERELITTSDITPFNRKLKEVYAAQNRALRGDSRGNIYLFTQGGITVYNSREKKVYELNKENGSLVHNFINASYVDEEENLWVLTQDGITKIRISPFMNYERIGNLFSFSQSKTPGVDSFTFRKSSMGHVWIYQEEYNRVFELTADGAEVIDISPIQQGSPDLNDIFYYKEKLYFRTKGKNLYHYNYENKDFVKEGEINYSSPPLSIGEFDYRIYSFSQYNKGLEQVHRESGKILKMIDNQDEAYTIYKTSLHPLNPGNNNELVLIDNQKDSVYFNIDEKLIINTFFTKIISKNFTGNYDINEILAGSRGDFWIAMHQPVGAIFRYYNGKIADYTDVLKTGNTIIENMRLDSQGRLLIATGTQGMIQYDYENSYNYKMSQGLITDRLAKGLVEGPGGLFFIRSNTSLTVYDPSLLPRVTLKPVIYKAEESYGEVLPYMLSQNKTFRFESQVRDLTFFVTAGTYINENELTYQFLTDRNREWSKQTEANSFTLNNLAPGEHFLRVRVTHPIGFQEEVDTRFIITPFWYETLLFKTALAMALILLVAWLVYSGGRWNTLRLQKKARELQKIVADKTKELKEAQGHLISAAREAGKAEIATEILHNAGNLLNSMNISLDTVQKAVEKSWLNKLFQANSLLKDNLNNLEHFLLNDPKGKKLIEYYLRIGEDLKEEKRSIAEGLDKIRKTASLLTDFVVSQNEYATQNWFTEECFLEELVQKALNFINPEVNNNSITTQVYFPSIEKRKKLDTQPSKILHILVSIYHNAIEAVKLSQKEKGSITTRIHYMEDQVVCEIEDNGVGIKKESVFEIFNFGYSTKQNKSGFSLHTCANFMSEMRGNIRATSEGPGKGATFILTWKVAVKS